MLLHCPFENPSLEAIPYPTPWIPHIQLDLAEEDDENAQGGYEEAATLDYPEHGGDPINELWEADFLPACFPQKSPHGHQFVLKAGGRARSPMWSVGSISCKTTMGGS